MNQTINKIDNIVIRVESDFKERLKKIAELSRRTLSDYCRLIIEKAEKEKIRI